MFVEKVLGRHGTVGFVCQPAEQIEMGGVIAALDVGRVVDASVDGDKQQIDTSALVFPGQVAETNRDRPKVRRRVELALKGTTYFVAHLHVLAAATERSARSDERVGADSVADPGEN